MLPVNGRIQPLILGVLLTLHVPNVPKLSLTIAFVSDPFWTRLRSHASWIVKSTKAMAGSAKSVLCVLGAVS